MGFLTEPIEEKVVYQKRKYWINASFDTVLQVQSLFREEEIPETLKLQQALKMLLVHDRTFIRLSTESKKELLHLIFECCINTQKRPETRTKEQKNFDFEYDGEYIYASFMLDYGIDLVDIQGKLHWKKFISLFQGLSERTKIREVMRIRTMDIPEFTGKNSKQIQEIQELKSYYALPVKGGGGQQGLDALFSTLERMAVKNG